MMSRKILVTAFEPFGGWEENSSRLCVERLKPLAKGLALDITTRLYPVDFKRIGPALKRDLAKNYDIAVHLGQNANSAVVALEEIGLNIRVGAAGESVPLIKKGPLALKTDLPVARWTRLLQKNGIPSAVSRHAGTYLCNAALFLSLHYAQESGLKTRSLFIHLPLDPSQVRSTDRGVTSLDAGTSAKAVALILARAGAA